MDTLLKRINKHTINNNLLKRGKSNPNMSERND
jgi:hypothetical protein